MHWLIIKERYSCRKFNLEVHCRNYHKSFKSFNISESSVWYLFIITSNLILFIHITIRLSSILAEEKIDTESRKGSRRHYSEALTRELNKYYDTYTNLSRKEKSALSANLGIPKSSIKEWMYRKRKRLRQMCEIEEQYQQSYKVKETINGKGIP